MVASDLVKRIRSHVVEDHDKFCAGRSYYCDCGYDLRTEGLLEMAAEEIERLEKRGES